MKGVELSRLITTAFSIYVQMEGLETHKPEREKYLIYFDWTHMSENVERYKDRTYKHTDQLWTEYGLSFVRHELSEKCNVKPVIRYIDNCNNLLSLEIVEPEVVTDIELHNSNFQLAKELIKEMLIGCDV